MSFLRLRFQAFLGLALTVAAIGACAGTPSANEPTLGDVGDDDDSSHSGKEAVGNASSGGNKSSTPMIEAEVGALNAASVKEAFQKAMPTIERCLADGQKKMPFLEGEMEVFVRVAGDGSTRWAFPITSSFGHRETEQCVVDAVAAQAWPQPEGGADGETTQYLQIGTNARPAVQLSADALGRAGAHVRRKLKMCRRGAQRLTLTLHIDPDGRVMAAGAAANDEDGRDAIACALKAHRGLRFASPGSYPGKAVLVSE